MKYIKLLVLLLILAITFPNIGKSASALVADCQADKDTKAYGYCLGFVTAHLGTVFLQEAKHETPSYCMGESMTFEIMIGLYIDYYEKHTDMKKLPAIRVLDMAMTEYFGCD